MGEPAVVLLKETMATVARAGAEMMEAAAEAAKTEEETVELGLESEGSVEETVTAGVAVGGAEVAGRGSLKRGRPRSKRRRGRRDLVWERLRLQGAWRL